MVDPVVHIANLTIQHGKDSVLQDLNWQIFPGEQWILGGPSGTGKTTLAKAIAGQLKYEGTISFHLDNNSSLPPVVHYVSNWFQFTNLEGDRNFYYQQRYNKFAKNDTLTVFAELKHFAKEEQLAFEDVAPYLTIFGFENFKDQQLIELSSGEHKRLQLVKALWLQPQVLVIDQPYTGLDVQSRKDLNQIFDQLADKGVSLLLISNDDEQPDCINRFAEIQNGKIVLRQHSGEISRGIPRKRKELPYFLLQSPKISDPTMVKMRQINISYGEKQVLKNIDWEVKAGEKWLLQGHNGSGKSTLLSLINGDHPQAYANDIHLFGKKRGSGESIWEIKAHLGIISPELHWYYDMNANVGQTIASGFFDSMSLYQKLGYEQQQKLDQVLHFFDLKDVKHKTLGSLPLGQQRLALLARTIVKHPELLILDEPCQGLDKEQSQYFNDVIDDLSKNGQTLIYVGHFQSQLPTCIDNRMVLEKGEIKSVERVIHKKETLST
ncbi:MULTISPECIES: ATP-binding cassette domain-containing protein [Sphingobacterium]|uniref:Molybdenum ABC transporter ATP-binding protein n=1 Tax=Sphingobacterium athyrii TaxID=2152717 RepID=A0A363NRT6_9SPHI|nr:MULTISPECIES: ATP-binding cassette domain-containing protein [Sphingobacterium]PUV23526.1 molybdenum ABC transporter ATP-binding protein [Sphingobacterium athyrii]QIH36453.1 ATP-binding cassette domain-containing protein [Sphingobacterium sp. DR205]